ncbi:MAG: right-handed parallel beta-helix repeat-containing protein [Candidatus Hodarchaeota archaeon]
MRRIFLVIAFSFIAFLFVSFASLAFAETYYVRKKGNDNNNGTGPTTSQAWRTIKYAVSQLRAGDTCYVMGDDGGTYYENVSPSSSGKPSNPITLAVQSGDTVSLAPTGDFVHAFNFRDGDSWWIVDGFKVIGTSGWKNSCVIRLYNNCNNNIFRNIDASGHAGKISMAIYAAKGVSYNVFEDLTFNEMRQYTGAAAELIYIGTWDHPTIEDTGNVFRRIQSNGGNIGKQFTEAFDIKDSCQDTTIEYCDISGFSEEYILVPRSAIIRYNTIDCEAMSTSAAGIAATENAKIYKNTVIHANGAGQKGIVLRDADAPTKVQPPIYTTNVEVYNNTIYDCQTGIYVTGSDHMVINNTISQSRGYELHSNGIKSVTVDYNNYYDDAGNVIAWGGKTYSVTDVNDGIWSKQSGLGKNDMAYNPLFINPKVHNFHLNEGSPCIDTGVDVGLPFYGYAPDMGALEHGSEEPPVPPRGLKIVSRN